MIMTPTHYEPGASAAEASGPSGGFTSRPTRAEDERRLSVPFPPDVRVIHIPHSFLPSLPQHEKRGGEKTEKEQFCIKRELLKNKTRSECTKCSFSWARLMCQAKIREKQSYI